MKFFWLLCCVSPLMAQTELYLPWVPQNETFQTKIILNNHNPESTSIQLEAARNSDEQDMAVVEISAFGSYQGSVDELFPLLGNGPGSVVTITSPADNITASCIVVSTTTESGSSPAQMNAIPRDKAAFRIAFHHLPIKEGSFSAPVIVNVGDHEATVTIHAFRIREYLGKVERAIASGDVFAEETSALFPEITGDLFLIAESDRPLLGSTFIFNGSREPSMASAERIENIPDPLNTFREIQVWPEASRIRIGESTIFNTWGDSLQRRPPGSINHLLTWINDSPDLIDLVNEGEDAGKVTAKKVGRAMIRAQAKGGAEAYSGVIVLGRPIQLSRGSNCNLSLRDCSDWEALETPEYITKNHELDPSNTEPKALEFFRIIGDVEAIRIKEIMIESEAGKALGKITGLEEGQTIAPGETVIFSLDVNLLEPSTQRVTFTINLEDQGTLLGFNFWVRPGA